VAPPFRTVEFDIMYGEGISKTGELLDLGVKANLVEKAGSWFSYDNERIGQGRENAKQYFKDNPAAAEKLERQLRENAGMMNKVMETGPEEEDVVDVPPAATGT
jgi:recombination protein RecA